MSITIDVTETTVEISQTGSQGPAGADSGITYATVAALKAATVPADGTELTTRHYGTIGDGGGGRWYYVAAATDTEDVGMIVAPNSGVGRYFRLVEGLAVSPRWWGAKGDDSTDDTVALQAAIDWTVAFGDATTTITTQTPVLDASGGTYCHTDLTVTRPIYMTGGYVGTRLKALPGTVKMLTVGDGSLFNDGYHGMRISNIAFDGDGEAEVGIWFADNGGTRAELDHVLVENVTNGNGWGIANEDAAFSMSWHRVVSRRNNVNAYLVHRIQNSAFSHCLFYGGTEHQVVIGDNTIDGGASHAKLVGDTKWDACQFEPELTGGATGAALYLNNVSEITLTGCHFEAKATATGAAIEIAPVGAPSGLTGATSTNIKLDSCHFSGASEADYAIVLPGDETGVVMTIVPWKFSSFLKRAVKNEYGTNKNVIWVGSQTGLSTPMLHAGRGGFAVGGPSTSKVNRIDQMIVGRYNPASSVLTLVGNAANGNNVVINATTYTFKTALTATANDVLIGASAAASLANLAAAINRTTQKVAGVELYSDATAINPDVYASVGSGGASTMRVIALTLGTVGIATATNAYVTTTSIVGAGWTGGTLAGGAANLNVPNIVAGGSYTLAITVPGARVGMPCSGVGITTWLPGIEFTPAPMVTADDTVTVTFFNPTGAGIDMVGAGVIKVLVYDANGAS